ncbi:PglZ domain-containing protein [Kribbella soli]
MSETRRYLADQLARKVDRHRVVVWVDPQGEYRDIAAELVPVDVIFEPFRGSWYELRRRAENTFARSNPRLVVYLDADEPQEDPLGELRAAGIEYRARLATVLRTTLKNELTAAKIEEIANAADSLTAAEALIEGGATAGPARLVQALRTTDTSELLLKLANGELADEMLKTEAASYIETMVGGSFASNLKDLPDALARHLVLCELRETLSLLPVSVAGSIGTTTVEQRRRAVQALDRWQSDRRYLGSFRQSMKRVEPQLALGEQLEWDDALADLDTLPAYEEVAFAEFCRRVNSGQFALGEDLAETRLANSIWVLGADETDVWRARWRVSRGCAQLRRLINSAEELTSRPDTTARLQAYVQDLFEVDRAHRGLELALLELDEQRGLEVAIRDARIAYESWLDTYLRGFTQAVVDGGLTHDGLLAQGQIHAEVVAPMAKHGTIAYFLVDALRFELGRDLVDALRRPFPDGSIELRPAVALLPSITRVGMANLCPGAEGGLDLRLSDKGKLEVRIGGESIDGVPARIARLQAAHGTVVDLTLDDVFRSEVAELGERIDGSNLVLVRSQEIDETGEGGKISAGLQAFSVTVRHLQRAVSRLANHGVSRFVITADHGFISLTRELGQSRIIEKPGGQGDLHRRAFIGRGGTAGEALMRIPLADIGVSSDLDVLVPRGLALISGGGARGFFHGGCSPQELVVPVVTIEVEPPQGVAVMSVNASIASKITSQVFTAKVLLNADLLSAPIEVRAVAVLQGGLETGVLVTAGGAETDAGFVRLVPGEEVTLGFRLTTTLERGDKVELHVFDARTDRRLATSDTPATVARRLEVDDEFA